MACTRFVHHPEGGFNGRVNGSRFVDGIAEVSGRAALFWFQRHGFKIADTRPEPEPEPSPVDPGEYFPPTE